MWLLLLLLLLLLFLPLLPHLHCQASMPVIEGETHHQVTARLQHGVAPHEPSHLQQTDGCATFQFVD